MRPPSRFFTAYTSARLRCAEGYALGLAAPVTILFSPSQSGPYRANVGETGRICQEKTDKSPVEQTLNKVKIQVLTAKFSRELFTILQQYEQDCGNVIAADLQI